MKIGILGTRGIPNNYGGFEQLAQYLSSGLVSRGHEVSVYNPHNHPFQEKIWHGVNIIHHKNPERSLGSLSQFIYDLHCINDSRKRGFDILLHLGYTSDSIWRGRWPKKAIHLMNMDGLEWKRSKYSRLTRQFLKWAEAKAATSADILIADSHGIQKYLEERYQKKATYIAYGADIFSSADKEVIKEFRLLPHCYFLAVARMEPENNIEMIIEGYLKSGQKNPLILIGSTTGKHGKILKRRYEAGNIIFQGAVYDIIKLNNLRFFSSFYFHGHSAGGTNPSLLEAMSCGCNIAAHRNIFNQSVLENDADFFSSADEIASILNLPKEPSIVRLRSEKNFQKIRTIYNWDLIVEEYEKMMLTATMPGQNERS